MKKLYRIILAIATFAATSTLALADGSAFTPLNFDDTSYSVPQRVTPTATPQASTNPLTNALSKVMPKNSTPPLDMASGENAVGNSNIQNAFLNWTTLKSESETIC